jgi:hypothetical protein
VLRIAGDRMAAFQSVGLHDRPSQATDPLVGGWGPIDLSQQTAKQAVLDLLTQIVRARNLLRIAGRETSGGKNPIDVEIELLHSEPDPNVAATQPWPNATPDKKPAALVMQSGDCYSYHVTNRSSSGDPVYVTILHVNSDMGIEQVLPYQEGTNLHGLEECMLRPGESRIEGPFRCNGVGTPSFGVRHTIVLATNEPNHFYMLNQPALPTFRGGRSSLGELLMAGAYFKTRNRQRPPSLYDNSWGSAVLQWTVVPTSNGN